MILRFFGLEWSSELFGFFVSRLFYKIDCLLAVELLNYGVFFF